MLDAEALVRTRYQCLREGARRHPLARITAPLGAAERLQALHRPRSQHDFTPRARLTLRPAIRQFLTGRIREDRSEGLRIYVRANTSLLRPILDDPNDCVESEFEDPEAVLGWLASAESLFRRYLFALRKAQKAAATVAPGREHEVVVVFGKRDEQAADLSKEVFKLLPELASVDPNDIDANRALLGKAMVNAITARFALASIFAQRRTDAASAENQPKPRPKASKKRPRGK